jgi:hypothetical protein
MKPETTEDILELMNGHVFSAVLGAAMELGIFGYWLINRYRRQRYPNP